MLKDIPIIKIAVGWLDHALVLRQDGEVLAWGNNDAGQCDISTTVRDVVDISAGYSHSVVCCRDGTIVVWGANRYGECTVPTDIVQAQSVVAGHNCSWAVLHDGSLRVWGNQNQPQCQIPENLPAVAALASGRWHTVVLSQTGSVYAWGVNDAGQCDVPVHVQNVVQVAVGGKHSMALTRDGRVSAWGDNTYGQCQIPTELYDVIQISAGERHSVALRRDGTVVMWGDNSWGQIQLLSHTGKSTYVVAGRWLTLVMSSTGIISACGSRRWYATVPPNYEHIPFVHIDGGQYHIVGLTRHKGVVSWGMPRVDILMRWPHHEQISMVDVADTHVLALAYDGRIIALGDNGHGQCNVPNGLAQIIQVAAGGGSTQGFSLALSKHGAVTAWGYNEHGQCDVHPNLNNIVYIAAGKEHALAITYDAKVVAWGNNNKNQCRVPRNLQNVICVKAGATHSVALTHDGHVVTWGSNRYKQCDVPTELGNVIQIDAGAYYTIVRTRDNRIIAWGDNEYGVCDVPVWLRDVQHIAAAYTYVIALLSSGKIVIWGNNSITDTDRLIQIGTNPRLQYIHPFAAYAGGEAQLFSTPSGLLKKYHTPDKTPAIAKLRHLIANPVTLMHHDCALIIWPQDLAYDPFTGQLVGYVMPFVAATQLIDVLDRTKRIARWPDLATDPRREWLFVLTVARWSAAVLAHIHAHGYVAGDLSPRNILVYNEGTVAFVDCDSYQVGDGSVYGCSVSTAGYRAPEVRKNADGNWQYNIHSDAFALAVAIFRLLSVNVHPYQGITLPPAKENPEDYAATKELYPHLQPIPNGVDATTYCEKKGFWPYDQNQQICLPPVKPINMQAYYPQLPAAVRGLFGRAFTGAPGQRPTPVEWVQVLDACVR